MQKLLIKTEAKTLLIGKVGFFTIIYLLLSQEVNISYHVILIYIPDLRNLDRQLRLTLKYKGLGEEKTANG